MPDSPDADAALAPEAQRLLGLAADYLLAHGVTSVSLSKLAKGIGSNNRMLLYYFGSKDHVFAASINAAYERFPLLSRLMSRLQQSASLEEGLKEGWRELRSPENLPYLRLFFESFGMTVRAPAEHQERLNYIGREWPGGMRAAFRHGGFDDDAAALATTQTLALWRGLQFALLAGTPIDELDAANDASIRGIVRAAATA